MQAKPRIKYKIVGMSNQKNKRNWHGTKQVTQMTWDGWVPNNKNRGKVRRTGKER